MRAGTQVAGNAIDRVFNPPIRPARRLRGTIDGALTLALGSVCAFGLTLGPAPMNTVALSTPAASAVGGLLDPAPGAVLVPTDSDEASSGDELPGQTFRPRLPDSSESTEGAIAAPPAEPSPSAAVNQEPLSSPPLPAGPPQQESQRSPILEQPNDMVGPQFMAQATALSVVENYRTASGLGAFVTADDCAQPVAHAVVTVTPSLVLPPGLAKKSLAPDPAFASVAEGPGAATVTIFRCG